MLKKEVSSHLLVTFVYFLIVSLFRLDLGIGLILLWVGGLVGTFLIDVDHIILGLDNQNKAVWAEKFRFLWQKRKYQSAIYHLFESHLEHRQLIFHSVLFQPILLIMTLFVLTSTGSLFGSGLVMSMNLHLLKDEWQCYQKEKNLGWLFWPIKREFDQRAQRAYLVIVTFFFGLLTLLLV
jgi:hypothetical protein